MREDAEVASRPKLGRKPIERPDPPSPSTADTNKMADDANDSPETKQTNQEKPAKIQTVKNPEPAQTRRPARSTRNPDPKYVDSVSWNSCQVIGSVVR